jgi:hypothetical protein
MPESSIPEIESAEAEQVLSKAVVRAAAYLEIPNNLLAKILGLSEATVSRLVRGHFVLEHGSKPFELAQLFVRLFRSLAAMNGNDDAASRSWLRSRNLALKKPPVELIQTIEGLTRTVNYVDARRARI